jgi:hypothetical protein
VGDFFYICLPKQGRHLGKNWYFIMARKFPRFLFSNPLNTKSPGPFVVHLLEPRLVFRVWHPDTQQSQFNLSPGENHIVQRGREGEPFIQLLDKIETTTPPDWKIQKAIYVTADWVADQYYAGNITF